MNNFQRQHFWYSLLSILMLSVFTTAVFAADMPKRKPGLWEIKTQMQGLPSMGPVQQCIDEKTDNLMQEKSSKQQRDCSVMEVKRTGNKVTIHSVCTVEGMTTVTSNAVFEGSFESAYKGTIESQYNPPLNGLSESTLALDARLLGPCQPGQKPGDISMPQLQIDRNKLNEMMNDPKIKELMEKQQGK